jgi:hypothetical protein
MFVRDSLRRQTALHVSTALNIYPTNVPAIGVTLSDSVVQPLDGLTASPAEH